MGSYIKRVFLHACVYFTAISFLILVIYQIISKDTSRGFQPLPMVMIFPFAICFAIGNIQFAHAKYHVALRTLLHYVLTVVAAFVFLYLPNKGTGNTPIQGLILFLVFTTCYVLFMGGFLIARTRFKRITRDESEYKKVYKN